MSLDPIELQVLTGALRAACEEMGVVLIRSAHSSNIKERRDASTGLFDADGPCANAVKDAQRTKTHAGTVHTLALVWGARALGDRAARTARWYRDMLERAGASTAAVT